MSAELSSATCKATSSLKYDAWRNFIASFKKFYFIQKTEVFAEPARRPIEIGCYESFFRSLREHIEKHYKSGAAANAWEISGVGYDEMRNSAILSWLLDCRESHGQGNVFLKGLLDWLVTNNDVSQQARYFLPKSEEVEGTTYWTRVESLPFGEIESRVDIEIGGPFVLFIEVKVNAQETGDQLKRYLKIAEQKAGSKKWGVLYLTKHGIPPSDSSLDGVIFKISWKQLATVVEKVIAKQVAPGTFIEQQLRHLCLHFKSI